MIGAVKPTSPSIGHPAAPLLPSSGALFGAGEVVSLRGREATAVKFLKQTFSQFSEDGCSTLAASLAYYTIFSLAPLLYLLLIVVSVGMSAVYEQQEAQARAEKVVQDQAAQLLGNEAASEEIGKIIQQSQQQKGVWWKWLISLAGILFGATGVMAALQNALNTVWKVRPDPQRGGAWTFITKRLLSLTMILGLGFLLLVSLILSAVISALGDRLGEWIPMEATVASVLNYAVTFLVTLIVFAAIYRFMPDARIAWRDVWVGALVTALLFAVGRFLLERYLSYAQPGAQLGAAAASLAVILVWVYYTSMIFLYGAEVTEVWAERFGRGVQPEEGAVRVMYTTEPPSGK